MFGVTSSFGHFGTKVPQKEKTGGHLEFLFKVDQINKCSKQICIKMIMPNHCHLHQPPHFVGVAVAAGGQDSRFIRTLFETTKHFHLVCKTFLGVEPTKISFYIYVIPWILKSIVPKEVQLVDIYT